MPKVFQPFVISDYEEDGDGGSDAGSDDSVSDTSENEGESARERAFPTPKYHFGVARTRKLVLAAVFPEFYTVVQVDALHKMMDDDKNSLHLERFGYEYPMMFEERESWKVSAGHFDTIKWVGSRRRLYDEIPSSPWTGLQRMRLLLDSYCDNYLDHFRVVYGLFSSYERALVNRKKDKLKARRRHRRVSRRRGIEG